jgi:hypothetical protein
MGAGGIPALGSTRVHILSRFLWYRESEKPAHPESEEKAQKIVTRYTIPPPNAFLQSTDAQQHGIREKGVPRYLEKICANKDRRYTVPPQPSLRSWPNSTLPFPPILWLACSMTWAIPYESIKSRSRPVPVPTAIFSSNIWPSCAIVSSVVICPSSA